MRTAHISDHQREQAEQIVWWHQIPLSPDFTTPGRDDSLAKLSYLDLPSDLQGKRLLDVGCSDGFFSFTAEARGAEVTAIDAWHTRGFDLAREVLGSRVDFHQMTVYDLCPETFGLFDIVLFLGVYYHLRHPLLALERIAAVTREWVLVESEVLLDPDLPQARFCGLDLYRDDPTTWWVPTVVCLMQNVSAAGFSRTTLVSRYGSRAVVKGHKTPETAGQMISEQIILNIDQPRPGSTVKDSITITGWAIDREDTQAPGIQKIEAFLDGPAGVGRRVGSAQYGDCRPDIMAFLGSSKLSCGYHVLWDCRDVPPGPHTLCVQAWGSPGWAYRTVQIRVER